MFDWLTPEMIIKPALEVAAWLFAYAQQIKSDAWHNLLIESPPALRLFFVVATAWISIDAVRRRIRRVLGMRI